MIIPGELDLCATDVKNCFPFSFHDVILIIDMVYRLEKPENINELRKAAFQYAQRLENS